MDERFCPFLCLFFISFFIFSSINDEQRNHQLKKQLIELLNKDSPDWIEIKQFIQINKNLIKYPIDNFGRYVLHYACWKKAPLAFVIDLIDDYPTACKIKTLRDNYPLPLHYACCFNQSETVIRILIENYPKACMEKDKFGDYPLHLACRYDQPESLIQLLITKYPKACGEKNIYGRYPLHHAIHSNQSESVIQLLTTEYPKAYEEREYDNGWYPLHIACFNKAPLSIIQLIVQQWPEALNKRDNKNKTPLDHAKESDDGISPNPQTIEWLESYRPPATVKDPNQETSMVKRPDPNKTISDEDSMVNDKLNINKNTKDQSKNNKTKVNNLSDDDNQQYFVDRTKILDTINQRSQQAIVSEGYIQQIRNPKEILGAGYFGKVYLGYDTELNYKFAIKTINNEILTTNGAVPSLENVQKIIKTFHTEQKVLMNLNHPNITMLLAYSFPTNNDASTGNYYLLYEYAERGSLDMFWKDDTKKEQLNFRRRVIIAYEVMTALRFLHEGNDMFPSCCHRDIKSANIVLKNNLSAQLIDCGLAKFVTDDNTQTLSTGVKGTPGYICPQYCQSGQGYTESCDIFSFGVVLVELLTGLLQNERFNFVAEYIDSENDEPRMIIEDTDSIFEFNRKSFPIYVHDFAYLAFDCMHLKMRRRPTGKSVIRVLKKILDEICAGEDSTNYYYEEADNTVDDSIEQHELLCERCRTYKKYVDNTICHMCFMVDELNVIKTKVDEVLVKLDVILPMLTSLDAKFSKEIPRLFVFYPAKLKSFWKNPKSWIRNKAIDTYHLQFVCAHTFRAINPPIKVRIVQGWMEKFAPVLAVSLYLMSIALESATNVRIDVTDATKALFQIERGQLLDLLENTYTILGKATKNKLKTGLETNNFVHVLNKQAYDEVKKLALKEKEWQQNMVLVKKPSSATTLWVEKSIAFNECNGYEVVNI